MLGGDYNVVPTDEDCYDPEGWADDALCRPEVANAVPLAAPSRLDGCFSRVQRSAHLYASGTTRAARGKRTSDC